MKIEQLQEINTLAAKRASEVLSKLTALSVAIGFSKVSTKKIEETSSLLAPEDLVVGLSQSVMGQVEGISLLAFPAETACVLSDLFLRRPRGTAKEIGELESSGLKEIANIVVGGYFTVVANTLEMKIMYRIPELRQGRLSELMNQVKTMFSQAARQVALIEVAIVFEGQALKGYLLFLFKEEGFLGLL